MANHLFKTSYGQCNCLWCGRRRSHLPCPITDEYRAALRAWAKDNGRTWKAKLIEAWFQGEDVGQELQHVRNILGPSGLMKIPSRILARE